jgi:hypothetical protein
MKKLTLALLLFFCYGTAIAQITFEEDTLSTFLKDARAGSMSLGDIDNDGDLDMFVSGKDHPNIKSTMYKNDGNGVFTEMAGTNFMGTEFGHSAFADVDNDGDQDVLLIGRVSSFSHTYLYINDGTGNFTENTSTPILDTKFGDFEFVDVDNDTDLDLIISGGSTTPANLLNPIIHTTLYLNNGSGGFTAAAGTPFEGIENSSITVLDIDNNQTQDLIITGQNASGTFITNLYTNDGSGNFSLVSNTPFSSLSFAKVEAADTDNDGDTDIFIIGRVSNNNYRGDLYTNDGAGNFSLTTGTSLRGGISGSLDFADFDKDGDADILMTGTDTSGVYGVVYENQGNNSFSIAASLINIYESDAAIGDIDNDGDLDAVIVGTPSINNNNNLVGSSFRPRMYFNETMTTGLFSFKETPNTFVYPNPSNGMLHFKSDEISSSMIRIFDAVGKLVYFDRYVMTNSQIWLDQPAGLYIVLIETNNVSTTQKLILTE